MNDTVTRSSNSASVDVDGLVALYVELRDKVAELKAKLKEEASPYRKGMDDLEHLLLKHLQDVGAESIKTASGTVYQHVERSATIKDKEAFREFVIANKAFDLLDCGRTRSRCSTTWRGRPWMFQALTRLPPW